MKRAEKDLHSKRKKEQLEIQECSFRPRTLHDSGSKLRSNAEGLRDSIQRLYPTSEAKSKVAEQIELERERSENLECTFAPNLALSMRSWKRQSSATAEWADRSRLTQESVRDPQPQGLPSEFAFRTADSAALPSERLILVQPAERWYSFLVARQVFGLQVSSFAKASLTSLPCQKSRVVVSCRLHFSYLHHLDSFFTAQPISLVASDFYARARYTFHPAINKVRR